DAAARAYATRSASACRATTADLVVMVGSEVGLGGHPETEAGIVFRARVGAANQALAAVADEVILVVAGLPLWVKGGPGGGGGGGAPPPPGGCSRASIPGARCWSRSRSTAGAASRWRSSTRRARASSPTGPA